jgi:hypothetical protein
MSIYLKEQQSAKTVHLLRNFDDQSHGVAVSLLSLQWVITP